MLGIKKRLVWLLFIVAILGYFYRYSPYRVEGLGYYSKIYSHRANSIAKANCAATYFNGFELDLVYDAASHTLDVNHPPTESIGLTFKAYLDGLKTEEQPFMWLDIKNLKPETADSIFNRISTLLANKNFKTSNVLIETKYPEALQLFKKAGFKTSYYLPTQLFKLNKAQLEAKIKTINKHLALDKNLAISSSYEDYPIIAKHFPKRTKYFWTLIGPYRVDKFQQVRAVLKDTTVKVVLFNFKTFKSDR